MVWNVETTGGNPEIKKQGNLRLVCNRGDTILRDGGLHTDLNQCTAVQSRELGQKFKT